MTLNTAIEKSILSQLYEVFPGNIERPSDIFPAHNNRSEIIDYLFDFHENGWVNFTNLSSKAGKNCSNIKITRPGITYLKSL
jgi:hypothetical protein